MQLLLALSHSCAVLLEELFVRFLDIYFSPTMDSNFVMMAERFHLKCLSE